MKSPWRNTCRCLPLLAIGLWTASYWKTVNAYYVPDPSASPDWIEFRSSSGRVSACSYKGLRMVSFSHKGWQFSTRPAQRNEWPGLLHFHIRRPDPLADLSKLEVQGLGFYYSNWHSPRPPTVFSRRSLQIPYWFIVLLLSIVPLFQLRRIVRHRRIARKTLCPTCGYDLRATPTRCPECGTAAA